MIPVKTDIINELSPSSEGFLFIKVNEMILIIELKIYVKMKAAGLKGRVLWVNLS